MYTTLHTIIQDSDPFLPHNNTEQKVCIQRGNGRFGEYTSVEPLRSANRLWRIVKQWLRLGFSIVLISLIAARYYQQLHMNTASMPAAEQVLRRSTPLFQNLLPKTTSLTASTFPAFNAAHKVWTVDCQDATGHDLAFIMWNAETEQLIQLTVADHAPTAEDHAITNPQDAQTASKAWLQRLKLGKEALLWTLTKVDRLDLSASWQVRWEAPGKWITIKLYADTGALRSIDCLDKRQILK